MSQNPQLDVLKIQKITDLSDFNRYVMPCRSYSCLYAKGSREVQCPTWGYPSEQAYYKDTSCVDSLMAIRVPFLAIHAEDDPVG